MAVTFESLATIRCDKCGEEYGQEICDGEIESICDCDCSSEVDSLIDSAEGYGWSVNLKEGKCLCPECKIMAGVLTERERQEQVDNALIDLDALTSILGVTKHQVEGLILSRKIKIKEQQLFGPVFRNKDAQELAAKLNREK